MTRKILFFLLFNLLFLPLSICQSIDYVRKIADNYRSEENYTLAIKEYQRCLFFSQTTDPEILYQIGECFQKLEQFEKAAEFFDKAFNSFTNDSLKINALFKKTECMLISKDYSLALTELLGISDTITGSNYYKKELYTAVAYFGMEDFADAEKSFINSVDPKYVAEREHIKSVFKNKSRFYKPKPTTASILSMCFPGLGQFYAGDIKNGFNAVILTSTLAYIGIRIAINQTVWDAMLTIAPWFQRYYQGGYMRAEKIAFEKRADKRRKAYEEIIQTIADTKN